eukprot:TRINITY_DN5916_c0_g2_i1.p1 TRINITY_DN5916_c0_g2~~TRINITY_DN5916_c0_g2_i1.p1  ORF type:complete len:952 (+),score=326.25 TRINITY_DN5916_c0_g2_i1:201-3056(+)
MASETNITERDKKWELVQIQAFTAWMNSYVGNRGARINNLQTDLQDGTILCQFLEIATKKKLDTKWYPAPKRKVQMLENLTIALRYIQNSLGIRLVGIGSEDVHDGKVKLILGLIWSLFRRIRMGDLDGGDSSGGMEEGLLKWVREQTSGYKGVNVNDFKYSFNDALAFAALINKYDPSLLNYDEIDQAKLANKSEKEALLNTVFDLANKHLDIPRLLDPHDLVEGDPDERPIQLYVSLFFHAFATKAEREKAEEENKRRLAAAGDINSEIQKIIEEKQRLLAEIEEMIESIKGLDSISGELQARLDALLREKKELEEEIETLKKKLAKFQELQKLEEELADLQEAYTSQLNSEGSSEDALNELREEIEAKKQQIDSLKAEISGLEDFTEEEKANSRKLRETESISGDLSIEISNLRKNLDDRRRTRKQRENLNEKLRKQNEQLKKRLEVQAKVASNWNLIKKNVQEHLEDVYTWREVQTSGGGGEIQKPIEVKGKFIDCSNLDHFAEQVSFLNHKLSKENNNMATNLGLNTSDKSKSQIGGKTSNAEAPIGKSGWLQKKGPQDWRRRWFVLKGLALAYYREEDDKEEAGSISLEGCEVGVEKNAKEGKFPLKIVVAGRKLILQAESEADRASWIQALKNTLATHASKSESGAKESEQGSSIRKANGSRVGGPNEDDYDNRPDPRVAMFLKSKSAAALYLDDYRFNSDHAPLLVSHVPKLSPSHITKLSLSNASLTDDHLEALSSIISSHIQVLILSKNKLTSQAGKIIGNALKSNAGLKELYVNDNPLKDAGLEAIASGLEGNNKILKVLDISGTKSGAKGVGAVCKAVGGGLEKIWMGRNAMEDEGLEGVVVVLSGKSVKEIGLGGNGLGDGGVEVVCRALKGGKCEVLDLSNNNISIQGALSIKKLLESNGELGVVDLSGNKISGGEQLSTFLSSANFFFSDLTFRRK